MVFINDAKIKGSTTRQSVYVVPINIAQYNELNNFPFAKNKRESITLFPEQIILVKHILGFGLFKHFEKDYLTKYGKPIEEFLGIPEKEHGTTRPVTSFTLKRDVVKIPRYEDENLYVLTEKYIGMAWIYTALRRENIKWEVDGENENSIVGVMFLRGLPEEMTMYSKNQ